jgi:hypothetical protein
LLQRALLQRALLQRALLQRALLQGPLLLPEELLRSQVLRRSQGLRSGLLCARLLQVSSQEQICIEHKRPDPKFDRAVCVSWPRAATGGPNLTSRKLALELIILHRGLDHQRTFPRKMAAANAAGTAVFAVESGSTGCGGTKKSRLIFPCLPSLRFSNCPSRRRLSSTDRNPC